MIYILCILNIIIEIGVLVKIIKKCYTLMPVTRNGPMTV